MDRIIQKKNATARKVLMAVSAIVALAILLLGWYVSFSKTTLKVAGNKITISQVKYDLFEEFIPVTGTVQPIQSVFLAATEGGTVMEVYAEDGRMINKGDAILRLSNQQFQMDAINREAQLLDQQNNLQNTLLAMDKQSTQLKTDLLQLDTELKNLERIFEMNKKLAETQNVSKHEMAKSEEDYLFNLERRKLLAEQITRDSLFRATQEGQINFSLKLIQKNLSFLQQSLENLVLKATVGGQLSSLRAQLGETKAKGENVAQIDDIASYKVRVRVGEHYISRVTNGLKGRFSFNGKDYLLTVFKIYPEVTNGEFEVDMKFEDTVPEGIKRGQSLQIKLFFSEQTKALLIPRGGFYQSTAGNWIYVVENQKAVKRNIRIGRQNPEFYEVMEGLEAGEKIISSAYNAFNNADELLIETSN